MQAYFSFKNILTYTAQYFYNSLNLYLNHICCYYPVKIVILYYCLLLFGHVILFCYVPIYRNKIITSTKLLYVNLHNAVIETVSLNLMFLHRLCRKWIKLFYLSAGNTRNLCLFLKATRFDEMYFLAEVQKHFQSKHQGIVLVMKWTDWGC